MTETWTPLSRDGIAWRAAQDLVDGSYVNLGLGLPVLASNYAPDGREIVFHSENGIVGVGPVATGDAVDADLVDAGSRNVTLTPGAAIVTSEDAFAMIRGGHVDVTLLGGFEVAVNGDFANWDMRVPGKGQLVGGAMDLAVGAKSVRILMQHTTKAGGPRLVERCALPLTATGVVDRIYTDLAVIDVRDGAFVVAEMVDGLTRDELQARTGYPLTYADHVGVLHAAA